MVRLLSLVVFAPLPVLAWYKFWYQGASNGLFAFGRVMLDTGLLPPSVELRRTYTHVPQIDSKLTILVAFFWPTFLQDKNPAAYGLMYRYFAIELSAVVALFVVESSRRSTRRTPLAFPLIYMILFQLYSAAVVVPVWCLVSLFLQARWPPSTIPARDSKIILPAVLGGYGIPTIAMSLFKRISDSTHTQQGIIAAWQPFPIYITLIWLAFSFFLGPAQPESAHDLKSSKRHLNFTYQVLSVIAAAGHVLTTFSILLSAAPAQIFKSGFLPKSALDRNDLYGLVHNGFLWDCLITLGSITAYALFIKPKEVRLSTFVAALLLLGPGYALLFVMEERDKALHRVKSKTK